MWWVAWRQHRVTIVIAVVVMLVIAVALVVFRFVLLARFHAAGCGMREPSVCSTSILERSAGAWTILRDVMVAAPVVLGVFVGAPIFPREFEQRTQAFALTQSVGRLRWWSIKITVAGVPVLAGLLGLGFLMHGVAASFPMTDAGALDGVTFQVRSIIPAAFGLLALAVAVTAGIVIRSVTASLIASLIVMAGLVVVIAVPLRVHLVPAARNIAAVSETPLSFSARSTAAGSLVSTSYFTVGPNGLFLDTGYLDAAGDEVPHAGHGCVLPSPDPGSAPPFASAPDPGASSPTPAGRAPNSSASPSAAKAGRHQMAAMERAIVDCLHRQGVAAQYTDYLPASALWPLRGVVTGLCAALAGLFLTLGAWRLRAWPGSRR